MTTPRTTAGRALRNNPEEILTTDPNSGSVYVSDRELTDAILAIEAEAARLGSEAAFNIVESTQAVVAALDEVKSDLPSTAVSA